MLVRFTIPIRFDDEAHPLDPTATSWDWFEVEAATETDARLWINDQFGNDIWCSTYTDDTRWEAMLATRPIAGRCIAKLTVDTVICPSCGHHVQPGTRCLAVA